MAFEQQQIEYPIIGLPNIGNTCYINSSIQVIFNLPDLMNGIKEFFSEINRKFAAYQPPTIIVQLINLFDLYQNYSIEQNLKNCISDFKKEFVKKYKNFAGCTQEDADEFLNCLMNTINDEINSIKQQQNELNNPLEELLKFKTRRINSCSSCKSEIGEAKIEERFSLSISGSNKIVKNSQFNELIQDIFKAKNRKIRNPIICSKC